MTATEVNGQQVMQSEPAESPLRRKDGEPVHFRQIRKLTLQDGTVMYGCIHCEFARSAVGAVRPHLKVHSTDTEPRAAKTKRAAGRGAVAVLARELEQITQDRDHWRDRARKAERSLNTLRRALSG